MENMCHLCGFQLKIKKGAHRENRKQFQLDFSGSQSSKLVPSADLALYSRKYAVPWTEGQILWPLECPPGLISLALLLITCCGTVEISVIDGKKEIMRGRVGKS